MQTKQTIQTNNPLITSWRQRKLFSHFHVCLATFIGSPLAGGFLLYHNFKTTGQGRKASNILIGSALVTAAMISLIMLVPDGVSGSIVIVPQIFGMSYTYQTLFGDAFEKFTEQGFSQASIWEAAGIGLLFMSLVASIILAILV